MYHFIKDELERIANKYNGKFEWTEESHYGLRMSKIPHNKYKFNIPLEKTEIVFFVEFAATGETTAFVSTDYVPSSKYFTFKKANPLVLLIKKKKRSLSAVTENKEVKKFVEELIDKCGLEEISRNTLFEPRMQFVEEDGKTTIKFLYNMAFKDKEKSIEHVIQFMDELNKYFTC